MNIEAYDNIVLDQAGRVDVAYYKAKAAKMRAEATAQFMSAAKQRLSHAIHDLFASFHQTRNA